MKEITIEQLKQEKGEWAVFIDSRELHEELRNYFNLCKYYGECGYFNYNTYNSGTKILEEANKYWTEQKMPLFIILENVYEIY